MKDKYGRKIEVGFDVYCTRDEGVILKVLSIGTTTLVGDDGGTEYTEVKSREVEVIVPKPD